MRRSVVLIIVGLIAIIGGVWLYLSGQNQAKKTAGSPMVTVKVPDISGIAEEGRTLFNANCSSCHGINAAGNDGAGPPLVHKIYEPGHHGDEAIRRAVKLGTQQHHWPFGNMAPVEGVDDDEVSKIIAYIRALQRANGID